MIPDQYRALVEAGGPESEALRLHFERRARLVADGPVPPPIPAGPPPPPSPPGAGTYVKRWLGWAGIRPTAGCGCTDLALTMDRMGPDWCEAHAAEILEAMRVNARTLGVPFLRSAASALLGRAIAKAREGLA